MLVVKTTTLNLPVFNAIGADGNLQFQHKVSCLCRSNVPASVQVKTIRFSGLSAGGKKIIFSIAMHTEQNIMIIGPYAKFEEQSTSDGNPISSTTAESPCL